MAEEKRECAICGNRFKPDVRHPGQLICPSAACRHKRQLESMKKWRAKKAASDSGASWKESNRRRSSEWRKKHQAYLKLYREEHSKERGEYMREYMRGYRKKGRQPAAPK
jgi:uncharacterized Zn finger protein (UPF0148 family)